MAANTQYTEKTLMSKEKIIYAARLHNFSYCFPVILLVLGLLLAFSHMLPDISDEVMETGEGNQHIEDAKYQITSFASKIYNKIPENLRPLVQKLRSLRSDIMSIMLITVGFATLIGTIVKKISMEHCVTSRKVILKKGLIAVDATEINLDRMEGVKVIQTAMDRMINRGRVLVTGIGMEQIEMKNIAEPERFRKATLAAMEHFVTNRAKS